jgi:hypothetical protein
MKEIMFYSLLFITLALAVVCVVLLMAKSINHESKNSSSVADVFYYAVAASKNTP